MDSGAYHRRCPPKNLNSPTEVFLERLGSSAKIFSPVQCGIKRTTRGPAWARHSSRKCSFSRTTALWPWKSPYFIMIILVAKQISVNVKFMDGYLMEYNFNITIKQPNSRMCFICGLENPIGLHLHIYETAPGVVESKYLAPDHFQGYPGILHAGMVAAIVDELAGRSLMGSDPSKPRFMFTAKMEVKYRKNVPIGKLLKVIGKAGKSRAKSAEAWAGIYDAETNELLAEGNTLLIDVPEDQIDMSRLNELGWKVYPE